MIPYFGSRKERMELTIRAGWRGIDEKQHCGHSDVRNNTRSSIDASKRRAHDWHQSRAHSKTASATFGRVIMYLNLEGRSVLVTGASQGIGAGIAMAFAREGCQLRLVARSAERLAAVAEDIVSHCGVDVETLAIDMTEQHAIARVAEFGGCPDVLVNNAGSIPAGNLWEVDEAHWRSGWELKVFGYINLVRALYPMMAARRRGVILNNIGNGGENFDFDYIAGSTGNAALMAFTRALGGRSLPDDGIRVIGVNPGPVDTDRIRAVLKRRASTTWGDASRYTELLERYPLGRAATVDEIAELFVFLASDKSGYTSGTIVTVDGGITSRRSVSQT